MRASAWLDYDQVQQGDADKPHLTLYPEHVSRHDNSPGIFAVGPFVSAVENDGDYTQAVHAAIQALMDLEPRIAQGHFYSLEIIA